MGNDSVVLGNRECVSRVSKPVRYANDIELTELARQITNELQAMNASLRDGYLDNAFLRAHTMEAKLDKIKQRLNDIKYGRIS